MFSQHNRFHILFRCDCIVICNKISQIGIILFTDRCFQRSWFSCNLHNLKYFFFRHIQCIGQFCRGRFVSQLQCQLSLHLGHSVDGFHHMHRYTDRTCLIGKCPCNGLANPPCCISTEFESLIRIKFLNTFDQSQVSFLDKIQKTHTSSCITLCNTYYQS